MKNTRHYLIFNPSHRSKSFYLSPQVEEPSFVKYIVMIYDTLL